jgi:hypothetical protein
MPSMGNNSISLESIKMKSQKPVLSLVILLSLFVSLSVEASYFTAIYGHVHQTPARTSPSLTTIQCGHPLKVIEDSKIVLGPDWLLVSVADHKGFVWRKYISEKRPDCYQGQYPKFFEALQLDLGQLYYWGRLSDHWDEGQVMP